MIAQNEEQTVRESVLEQLILLLSDISIDDLPCAAIYENHLQKKVPAYRVTSSLRDLYTPPNIAQCLAAFLDPGQGTAYDLAVEAVLYCWSFKNKLKKTWNYMGRLRMNIIL